MGILYHMDHEKDVGYICWSGTVTAADFIAQARRNISDPDWPPQHGLLADLRHASVNASFDAAFAAQVVKLYLPLQVKVRGLRAAIVANSLFEKAKIFERIVSGYSPSVIVFNDLDTACVWLGVDVKTAKANLQLLREKAQVAP